MKVNQLILLWVTTVVFFSSNIALAEPPVITCPNDITIGCDESSHPDITGWAIATDDNDPDPQIQYSDQVSGTCPKIITRTWTAIDVGDEGLTSEPCEQVITIEDNDPPVLTCSDVVIFAPQSIDTSVTGIPEFTDCDQNPDMTFTDELLDVNIVKRHWIVTDSCGNSSECYQTITIQNNTTISISTCDAWGVPIQATEDRYGQGDGNSPLYRHYLGGKVTFTAPKEYNDYEFERWSLYSDSISNPPFAPIVDVRDTVITLVLNGYDLERQVHYGLLEQSVQLYAVYWGPCTPKPKFRTSQQTINISSPGFSPCFDNALYEIELNNDWDLFWYPQHMYISLGIDYDECMCLENGGVDSAFLKPQSGRSIPLTHNSGPPFWINPGEFRIDNLAGEYDYLIVAWCSDFAKDTIDPGISYVGWQGSRSGTIYNRITGRTVPKTQLNLYKLSFDGTYKLYRSQNSDDDGGYKFTNVDIGTYIICTENPTGFENIIAGPVTVSSRAEFPYTEIELEPVIDDTESPLLTTDTTNIDGITTINGVFTDNVSGIGVLNLTDEEFTNVSFVPAEFSFGDQSVSFQISQVTSEDSAKVTIRCVDVLGNYIDYSVFIPSSFVCGDANDDENVDILDIIILIDYKFKNGPEPINLDACDVNGDTNVDILDIIYLIDYKFKNGPEPNCP